jgi:hypothetical protein
VLNDPLIALVAKMDLFDTHATTDVVVIVGAAFRINNFVPFREYPLMLTPFLPNEVSSMDTKERLCDKNLVRFSRKYFVFSGSAFDTP